MREPERKLELHIEIHGRGPTLLLAHGLGGSARNFRPQVRVLGDRYRFVLFDLLGHARSAAPQERERYRTAAGIADVERVLAAAHVERAVVGGLSLGAALALQFALMHPARVRGLILASYPARPESGGLAAVAADFAAVLEREGCEAAGARFVWGPESGLDPVAKRLVRQGFRQHDPQALAHWLREFIATLPPIADIAPQLRATALPVLLIAGEQDFPSLAAAQEWSAALPEAYLVVIPRAGHVVNVEQPAAFNAALVAFEHSAVPEKEKYVC